MNSFLVDNSEHKKAKGLNKNVVVAISHNEYKDLLLNNKCIRHLMNRIQSKDHKQKHMKSAKYHVLSCFDDKKYIRNNGYDGQLLLIIVNYKKTVNNYLKKHSCQACFNFRSNQDSFFVKHIKFEKCKAT